MYTEKVMDHFQHPRNVGEIENASAYKFNFSRDYSYSTCYR